MSLSVSAWLQHKLDEYRFSVRDLTVDFYLAQAKLNRAECTLQQLRQFNDTCLDMAEICQLNGDDQSYLHAMGKLHHRLFAGWRTACGRSFRIGRLLRLLRIGRRHRKPYPV